MADNNTAKKKKKTMVSLPGSLKNLVHNVQSPVAAQPAVSEQQELSEKPVRSGKTELSDRLEHSETSELSETSEKNAKTAKTAAPAKAEQPAGGVGEGARTVTRESTDDSWGLFLDLAREYKEKDSQLATIYIDRDLKTVLDRLRASRDVRMPTTAILSAIVARFIYDNEQRIKDAIYGDRLI